jgi:hypothetical protein
LRPVAERNVRDRDQPGALVNHALQSRDIDLAVIVVGHDHDLDAGLLRHLQVGDVVRGILAPAGQDAIARLELERVEGEVPAARSVLDEGDFARIGADQLRHGRIEAVQLAALFVGRLVTADFGLELEMAEGGVERALALESRTRSVEVQDIGTARRFGPEPREIEGHGPSLHRP